MVPVSPVSIFQSGSIGKMFTAMAIMLQVEDGKLALSDPLTRFFPDAPASWSEITVYQLLTHSSGIPDYAEGLPDYRKDYTEQELAALAFPRPLDFPPGTRWSYSNTAYDLLGIIVNRVSGKFYGDVLAERVFKPLGMTTARIISEADIVPNRSDGYRLVDGVVKNQEWVSPSLNTVASGALYFSVEDMIAWDAGVRRRAILTPESWDLVLKPVQLKSGKPWPYGFGWFLGERAGQPMHRHSGSWQGFKTSYARFIGDDLSIIVLANLEQANPGRILEGIAALIDPALAEPKPSQIEDTEPQVTARLALLLDSARAGMLDPADFAFTDPEAVKANGNVMREQLARLGPATGMVLVERTELGDDRMYRYEMLFGDQTLYYSVGLAPDDRITEMSLSKE
jgi:CubicO group peptidase (beta-lactamase class C family)